jgi:ABC-2 type transport system permease protein
MRKLHLLNRHVAAVMENEWSQLMRSKIIIFTTLAPPVLLVGVALSVLLLSALIDADSTQVNRAASTLSGNTEMLALLNDGDAVRATLLTPFLLLFQMIPLVVPITIGSYSIVGEKQSRSLEALLATPIRTWELLAGKALAAALPGILATWYAFAIFALAARFAVSDDINRYLIFGPTWMLSILVLTPLFTLLAVGIAIIISSRVRDPQSAQQLGSLVILPVIGALVAQVTGLVNVGVGVVLGTALAIGLLDVALLALAVRLFRRETILTTWR